MVNLGRGEGTRGLVGRRRNEWQPGPLEPRGIFWQIRFPYFDHRGEGKTDYNHEVNAGPSGFSDLPTDLN